MHHVHDKPKLNVPILIKQDQTKRGSSHTTNNNQSIDQTITQIRPRTIILTNLKDIVKAIDGGRRIYFRRLDEGDSQCGEDHGERDWWDNDVVRGDSVV